MRILFILQPFKRGFRPCRKHFTSYLLLFILFLPSVLYVSSTLVHPHLTHTAHTRQSLGSLAASVKLWLSAFERLTRDRGFRYTLWCPDPGSWTKWRSCFAVPTSFGFLVMKVWWVCRPCECAGGGDLTGLQMFPAVWACPHFGMGLRQMDYKNDKCTLMACSCWAFARFYFYF